MIDSRFLYLAKVVCALLIAITLCRHADLSARTVTFGYGAASTGWLDVGLVHNMSSPQTATYTDAQAMPSGDIVFSLKVSSSAKLGVGNNNLKVRSGNSGSRIDSGSFANPADDEWISFEL